MRFMMGIGLSARASESASPDRGEAWFSRPAGRHFPGEIFKQSVLPYFR